jgi:adenylylsulfate kinase
MSGAGKSLIGRNVYAQLKAQDPATVLVDGDDIREIFRHDRSDDAYSLEGRRLNAERIRKTCAWLDRQNINVVCCILSVFEDSHDWNRKTYSKYFEVFVDVPFKDLVERHPHDLYGKAQRGEMRNVVGVDIPFAPPANPDLVIENASPFADPEEMARRILAEAQK